MSTINPGDTEINSAGQRLDHPRKKTEVNSAGQRWCDPEELKPEGFARTDKANLRNILKLII